MTIVNYASISISKLKASLNDDARIIIYNRHMFIVQATDSRNFQSPILKIQYLNLITRHCALLVSSPQCWVSSPGNAKGGSITVTLTSCLTGLDESVLQIKIKIVSCYSADSKSVKQEVYGTMIVPPVLSDHHRIYDEKSSKCQNVGSNERHLVLKHNALFLGQVLPSFR
jgi:hypothetical protein